MWVGHAARMGQESVQGSGGQARRKETAWKTKHRWEDEIRMYLREFGWGV
jgi:hypothetical protein